MSIKVIFLFTLLLLAPTTAKAQKARSATCEVRPLWVGGGVRSANLGHIASFQLDGNEGVTFQTVEDKNTSLTILVGIDFRYEYSKQPHRPYEIRLAIKVTGKEDKDIFETVGTAEASTRYGKRWNLAVSQNVNYANRLYIYTLRCWDNAGSR